MRCTSRGVLAVLLLSTAAAAPMSLDEVWAAARTRSPTLQAADADVAGASAAAGIAGRWLPDPSLQGSVDSDAPFQGKGELSADVQLQQQLRWPMETSARSAAARADVDAAGVDRTRAEVVLWRDVAAAYVGLVAAQEEQALRVALREVAVRVREAAVARATSGQSPEIEAAFADVDVAAAESAAAAADADVARAEASLCRLMGDAACEVTVAWPALVVPALDDAAVVAAIEQRAAVRAGVHRVEAANAVVDAEGWARLPAPALGVRLGFDRRVVAANDDVALVDDDQLLGLSVSIPLPLFSAARGDTEVVAALRDRRDAELRALRLEALTQTRGAIDAWRATKRARDAWIVAEPRFEQALRWLADGYVGGAVSLDDLLGGRDRIARARLDAITARRDEVVAAATALAALGRIPGTTP